MLMKRQNRIRYVWGGGLLKGFWTDFHCFSVQVVLHYLLPFIISMIQATSTLIVCDFHCSLCSIFILQNYISLTLIIVCVCFLLIIDFLSFYLLVSYLLIQFMHHHYCHPRMLIAEKCSFLFNRSSKICKTSHYLKDVICHLLYYIIHIVSLIAVNKLVI